MIFQAIVQTPSNLDILAQDANGDYIEGNSIVLKLAAMQAEWPSRACPDGGTMCPGTRVVSNEKWNHVILSIGSEDPLALLESELAVEGKDWEVKALLPLYRRDMWELEFDEFDIPTGEYIPVVPDLSLVPADIEFLADDVDENGNPVRPTPPRQMHHWSGCVVFEVPA